MIQITNKNHCCGCSACAQICPKQCIAMMPDSEGFCYPKINETICVKCGLCEKVCPMLKSQNMQGQVHAWAAYCKEDKIRLASSSGGIFSLLAEEILEEGGVVFGAAFDGQMMVHHVAVESVRDLERLRGSKYLQSRIENSYADVKAYLAADRKVLFSGTACQIAGLLHFLGRPYEKLWTVDVLCHGVPTPTLWKNYLSEQNRAFKMPVRQISFRDKSQGWKKYQMAWKVEGGEIYRQPASRNPYMRLFLSNICLRPSCYDCHFKGFPRVSDLTLGDCWGVEQHSPEMDDDKGTSVVIVNTEKGNTLREKIAGRCVWKEEKLDVLLPPTADSRKSVQPHPNRRRFFLLMVEDKPVSALLQLIRPSFKKRVQNKCTQILKYIKI